MAVKYEGTPTIGQIVRRQDRAGSSAQGLAVRAQAIETREQSWIDNPEAVALRQKGVLVLHADLEVVGTFYIRHVRSNAGVDKPSALAEGLALEIGSEVVKRIIAGIIVVLILPVESRQT